jgi:hypothetical protein
MKGTGPGTPVPPPMTPELPPVLGGGRTLAWSGPPGCVALTPAEVGARSMRRQRHVRSLALREVAARRRLPAIA